MKPNETTLGQWIERNVRGLEDKVIFKRWGTTPAKVKAFIRGFDDLPFGVVLTLSNDTGIPLETLHRERRAARQTYAEVGGVATIAADTVIPEEPEGFNLTVEGRVLEIDKLPNRIGVRALKSCQISAMDSYDFHSIPTGLKFPNLNLQTTIYTFEPYEHFSDIYEHQWKLDPQTKELQVFARCKVFETQRIERSDLLGFFKAAPLKPIRITVKDTKHT